MKIENVKALGEYFKDVPIGEVFKSNSQLYIKIPNAYEATIDEFSAISVPVHAFDDYKCNAMDIITNGLCYFDEEEIVHPKQAVLKIYENK